ncbi:hydantoin racemase [Ameyamaea chiangmaiensis NBRC 103196]|uniref:Hydantoin racemase n=1 Tax=Ameyamaea chiangmaiensis TaxID=442969 RepID=A0A850PCG2_9PROT|nr:aspartate/glutamate racemase family protein [Ameyamaea chiangmaiensis]MBS4076117.1 hypothetical protein [Ameyamaea chiangmaiensis]NVN39632.1 hydantoin racemase [Ameyamaea chiangmaiensis]GBQ67080.1 hydantoin racemase [Ameyamaea chiangmaiensis NBRC 103196]
MPKIVVINPNSSADVTASMRESVSAMARALPYTLDWITNQGGPPGIETDAHVHAVASQMSDIVGHAVADAFVIGCFSDPGVSSLRETQGRPIIGIAEAAYRYAMTQTRRFGVLSIVEASVVRHRTHLHQLGIASFMAGDRPLDLGVAELAGGGVLDRLVSVGRMLRDVDGAEVVILGCAGLGRYRLPLQAELGMPVIDPVMASIAQAATELLMRI